MTARRRPMAVPDWWLTQVDRRRRRRELVVNAIGFVVLVLFVLFVLPVLFADALPVYR